MSNGNFRRALLDADRELSDVRFVGERDVRSIVAARRRTRWQLPALALAGAITALLIMRAGDREPSLVAGFEISAPASSYHTDGIELEVLATSLELDVPGFGHVTATRGARVKSIDRGIQVVGGTVEVDVIHRAREGAPALVRVSHGTIAVLGTRFTIEQSEHGGRVVLHEGRIRFDGDVADRSIVLLPGASLTWPLTQIATSETPASNAGASVDANVAAPVVVPSPQVKAAPSVVAAPDTTTRAPTGVASPDAADRATRAPAVVAPRAHDTAPPRSEASTPAPGAPPPSESAPPSVDAAAVDSVAPAPPAPRALDIDRVIAEVANLRARRRYADAAALLEQTLTRQLPTATHERLSYELGEIHTYQLTSSERACSHWRSHRARFPNGRYTTEIDAAVRRLDCEGTTP